MVKLKLSCSHIFDSCQSGGASKLPAQVSVTARASRPTRSSGFSLRKGPKGPPDEPVARKKFRTTAA